MMKIDRRELLAVFVGGVFGALVRVAIVQLWPSANATFPWAVFVINVSGAFLLGYLVAHLNWRGSIDAPTGFDASPEQLAGRGRRRFAYARQLMGTGFCGAYTTFSTVQLELLHMVDARRYGLAVLYVGLSVVCGYTATYTATALARQVWVNS